MVQWIDWKWFDYKRKENCERITKRNVGGSKGENSKEGEKRTLRKELRIEYNQETRKNWKKIKKEEWRLLRKELRMKNDQETTKKWKWKKKMKEEWRNKQSYGRIIMFMGWKAMKDKKKEV